MNEAQDTWALVIGIDQYDNENIPALSGAVRDAAAVIQWLRSLGVPDSQIILHASPTPATTAVLDGLGIPSNEATREATLDSLYRLGQVPASPRLFIFLCGHGLYEPTTGPVFLLKEAGPANGMSNLGLDAFTRQFLSLRFRRQFLFMDGCQNYPYSEGIRPTMVAQGPPNAAATPVPENGLIACFGAGQGQLAREVNGRGLFLRHLLAAVDPSSPHEAALDFDFETGERSVNLMKAMTEVVIPSVQAEAKGLDGIQTPTPTLEGAAGRTAFPLFTLKPPTTSSVRIDVAPPEAAADVRLNISIQGTGWVRRLPVPGASLTLPIAGPVPEAQKTFVRCEVTSAAQWDATNKEFEFTPAANHETPISFEFQPRAAEPAARVVTTRGRTDVYRVEVFDDAGSPIGPFGPEDYHAAARSLGTESFEMGRSVIANGVEIETHESGPVFHVSGRARHSGRRLASRWASEMVIELEEKNIPAGIQTTTQHHGQRSQSPNLEFELSRAHARALGGCLFDRPSLKVEEADQDSDQPAWRENSYSLSALSQIRRLTLEPGPYRVRLDLPWGTWRRTVDVRASIPTKVRLPRAIGVPPLRNRLTQDERETRTGLILWVGGQRRSGTIRGGLFDSVEAPLATSSATPGRWALETAAEEVAPTPIVSLGRHNRVSFPVPPQWPMAVDLGGKNPRIEPVSPLPFPQWDLLVAAGKLDALNEDDANELVYQKWDDPVLGIAGAYGLVSTQRWDLLQIVTGNLRGLLPALDVRLLSIAARNEGLSRLTSRDQEVLREAASQGDVPYFRWGVRLALDLLAHADDPDLQHWGQALGRIESNLSPFSIWTVWRE